MNILVVCHYGLYEDLSFSFVHAQAKAYVSLGHRVKVLVPIAIAKPDWTGSHWKSHSFVDGQVDIIPVRFLSLSSYGEKHFNTSSAIASLKLQMSAALGDFQPDIIHAHTLGFDSEIGKWLKRKFGIPLVVTTHGSDCSVPYEQGNLNFLYSCCDGVDHVVSVSSVLGKKLRSCGTNTPISAILNGYAAQNCSNAGEKKRLLFLQAGHMQAQKRPAITIEAFAKIHSAYPDAKLTMIGEGPDRKKLEMLCKELGIQNSVRFTGQISNQEVLSEMAQTQFFVMPSVREGLGIVYLEAMASGCITIGTEGEGIADVITSGKNGFLVPPDNSDAIVRIVEWCVAHSEESMIIAEKGKQIAQKLTWERNAQEYISLFEGLIKE